jgi:hypothetical protein
MRFALIGFTAATLAFAASAQLAHAQFNAPYCSFGGGPGSSGEPDCSFRSMAQCRASARGLGRYCAPNPNYRGPRRGNGPSSGNRGYD